MPGSLVVVGTGIRSISQITFEAASYIRKADKVLFLASDFTTKRWILAENKNCEELHRFYADGKPRAQTYTEIKDHILSFVRAGLSTCVALYGHPGIFAAPGHMAIQEARAEGYSAQMLPGVSAEDSLFADLGLDPGAEGCQSFEATDFLIRARVFDPYSLLILWQVGVIGHMDYKEEGFDTSGLAVLTERLLQTYPPSHEVILYEAATHVLFPTRKDPIALADLPSAQVSAVTTLCVPRVGFKPFDPVMLARLGLSKANP